MFCLFGKVLLNTGVKSSLINCWLEWVSEWVSEWVLFYANSAIFQLYHGENKLFFNEMMMHCSRQTLSGIFIVLSHWNNSPRLDMSLHSDTLSRFRANQSLLFLLNAACGEARNTNFIVFDLIRPELEPMIYRTRGKHANHYATLLAWSLTSVIIMKYKLTLIAVK
jgi:hypothetical protein